MKNIKLILTSSVFAIFLLSAFDANAKDCSEYKLLSHKWNACKLGSIKDIGKGGSETKSTNTSEVSGDVEKKEGILGKLFQKPKWMK
jgi:hypothetical protein